MVLIIFNCSHICVYEHSYFLIASAGYRSQYAIYVFLCFSFFISVALELFGRTMESS